MTSKFVALVAGVALLAACGSSADDETFRVGLQGPLTGSQQDVGQGMLRGAQLAADELNANGGIDGRTVEIVAIDDAADPSTGVTAAEKAIDDGLDAIVGPYNSGVGLETLPLYEAAGLVPLRLTSADTTAGFGVTLQPMTSQIAPTATAALTTWLGATSVALITDESQGYTASAAEAMRSELGAAGVTIVSDEAITPGADSYADVLATVLAAEPDVVYVITYFPEAGAIARDLVASGSDVACLADYGAYDNGYITAAGADAASRCNVVGVPAPDDFAGSASLVAAYTEKFSAAPGAWSPYTYDSVRLLAEAVATAGGTDATKLEAALIATSGWSGWTGPVGFEAETGNREPAPVTVNTVDTTGAFHVNSDWASAVGFGS